METSSRKNILAISGSTRSHSTNRNFLRAIAEMTQDTLALTIFEGLSELPHFNPDLDDGRTPPPASVADFRRQIAEADGVIICTPEYAMGVPGTLKNAIDWTVSSCEFSHKPVALITASSLGEKGHSSLLGTPNIIESRVTDDTQLCISFAKTKISTEGVITDAETLGSVKKLVTAFVELVNAPVAI